MLSYCYVSFFLLSHQVKQLATLLDLYQQLCQLRIWLWSLNSLEAIAVLGIVFCLSEPRLTAFCFSFFARWSWTESSHEKFRLSGIRFRFSCCIVASANKAPGHRHSAAGMLQKRNSYGLPWIWRGWSSVLVTANVDGLALHASADWHAGCKAHIMWPCRL